MGAVSGQPEADQTACPGLALLFSSMPIALPPEYSFSATDRQASLCKVCWLEFPDQPH